MHRKVTIGLALFSVATTLLTGSATAQNGPLLTEPNPAPATIHVSLPDAVHGVMPQASAFNSFGCTGQNQSPHIVWSGAPATARSFVVTIHDPDAPTGVGFFHWIVLNLPSTTTELRAGAPVPSGAVETYTDFGHAGYGGPCPPPGENHRYVVTVYALDVPHLDLPAGATGAFVRFNLRGHTVALGRAIATYRRP